MAAHRIWSIMRAWAKEQAAGGGSEQGAYKAKAAPKGDQHPAAEATGGVSRKVYRKRNGFAIPAEPVTTWPAW